MAMPEVGLGFFPDVGGTWLLSRAPGEVGTYFALTGKPMSGEERSMQVAEAVEVRTRIQMVYMEMPEIRLTRHQIRRLLSLPVDVCEDALRALVASGFLRESLEGVLVRGRGAFVLRH